MARQNTYYVRNTGNGAKLAFEAFGVECIMHSKQAAQAHAENAGAEAVFVGLGDTAEKQAASVADVPEQTRQEAEYAKHEGKPQAAPDDPYGPASATA